MRQLTGWRWRHLPGWRSGARLHSAPAQQGAAEHGVLHLRFGVQDGIRDDAVLTRYAPRKRTPITAFSNSAEVQPDGWQHCHAGLVLPQQAVIAPGEQGAIGLQQSVGLAGVQPYVVSGLRTARPVPSSR